MIDVPPQPPRSRFPLVLLLLVAFAAGVFAERRGWLPGRTDRQPARLGKTFAPFWEAWDKVDKYYVDRSKVDDKAMTEGAIRGMLESLGDQGHTAYLTKEQSERQNLFVHDFCSFGFGPPRRTGTAKCRSFDRLGFRAATPPDSQDGGSIKRWRDASASFMR